MKGYVPQLLVLLIIRHRRIVFEEYDHGARAMTDANDHELPPEDSDIQFTDIQDLGQPLEGNTPVLGSMFHPLPGWVFAPLRSRGKLRIASNIGLALVLLVVMVGLSSPGYATILKHFLAPTPSPPPTGFPRDDLFSFRATPEGSIFIDGQLLPRSTLLKPLQLLHGKHLITWKAAPFKPLSCIVTVPSLSFQEMCPYESIYEVNASMIIRAITFTASLTNLSDTQQTALKRQVQANLDHLQATETLRPGEHYLRGPLAGSAAIQTATQTLLATLHFHLDTDLLSNRPCLNESSDECTYVKQNCLQFCTIFDPTSSTGLNPSAEQSWDIVALFYSTWTYTTESGQLIAKNQPDGTGNTVGTDHSVLVHVIWDHTGWHTSIDSQNNPSSVDPACASINNMVNGPGYYENSHGPPGSNLEWGLFAGTNHAAGCLGIAFPSPEITSTPATFLFQPAYFLYRFGVLLAANTLAHSFFPNLPQADTYEQGVAQRIANQYRI